MKIKRRYIPFIILLTSLNVVFSQKAKKCGFQTFQCKNGDCIASVLLCDGWPNCRDNSDETEEECSKPGILCSDYAFRCNYGACIDGDLTCNGARDCFDNSDETLPRCRQGSVNTANSTQCSSNQFKCDNGQCIDSTAMCDGNVDCIDQSDETYLKCGSFNCPQSVFRCNYGACIDGDLKCNGVKNCADGSDEDPKLCEETTRPTPSTTEFTIPTSIKPTSPFPQTSYCLTPEQPKYGKWELEGSQCQLREGCNAPGVRMSPGTYLSYSCNPGYRLQGPKDVFCISDGKWFNIPQCVEINCKSLVSESTEATCSYYSQWVSCESPALPGTIATLQCRNGYNEADTSAFSAQRKNVRCNDRGQWEPQPIHCRPVCGIDNSALVKPLIVNGTTPSIAEFPWHATLYEVKKPNGPKEFSCGASIIKNNLLVTAAHCVYDEWSKKLKDPSKYYIATGNIFRDYDSQLHNKNTVKKARVKNIYINCNYLGLEGNYASDIAILEIDEPFVFSSLLLPACLDPNAFSDQAALDSSSQGKVAGFGRTATGNSSFILQSVTLPYVPHNECKSAKGAIHSEKFITSDKFCAGYTNGTSVCDGDSGGGLVFKSGGLWYLRGIVSVGLGETLTGGTRSCNSYSYSLYTRISSHLAWIQDVTYMLEMSKPFNDCNRVNNAT